MGHDLTGKVLSPGVSQRKDGRYQGRYTDKFGKRRTVYGKSAKEVETELAIRKVNEMQNKSVYESILLDEWYEIWMKTYISELSKATQEAYETAYRLHIKNELGNRKMDSIRPIDVKRVLIKMVGADLSQSTIYATRKILSGMFRTAVENEYAVSNPITHVRLPHAREEEHLRALTVEEQRIVLDECKRCSYGNFIKAQLSSGLRCGELAGLSESDLDYENRLIHVRQTLSRYRMTQNGETKLVLVLHSPKTKTSIRSVPMTDLFVSAVKNELETRTELAEEYKGEFDGLIFRNNKGKPVTTAAFNAALRRLVDRVNANGKQKMEYFSSHCLRHTFTTRLVEKNLNPKSVQHILGHASINMTMSIYAHVQDEHLKSVGEEIKELF